MPKRATVCGVQVHTWGTSYGGGTGFLSWFKKNLYGGNLGHASMTLIIPDDAAGAALVKQYCVDEYGHSIIPHKQQRFVFADGAVEDVYVIFFSAWPGANEEGNEEGNFLSEEINEDRLSGYTGVDFQWNEKIKNDWQIQERIFHGILGSHKQSIGPVTIEHYGGDQGDTKNNISPHVLPQIKNISKNYRYIVKLNGLEMLKEKLSTCVSRKKCLKLSDSTRLLIKNVATGYNDSFLNRENLSVDETNELLQVVESNIKALKYRHKHDQHVHDDLSVAHDRFLTVGALETGSVSLPLSNEVFDDVGMSNGLNVDAMLRQMHSYATDNLALTEVRNCSELIAQILTAGVQQPHLKSIFVQNTIFGINIPQTVYNAALKVNAGIINNERSNFWHTMQFFNPARPIEKLIKFLIKSGYDNSYSGYGKYYVATIVIVPIMILLIPLIVIKAVTWPINMLGGFLAKSRVNAVHYNNSEVNTELNERKIIDRELKSEIDQNLKIKQINIINPEAAILHFAIALSNPESIPVFTNSDVDKLKTYITQRDTTPEELKNSIVALALPLPENLDYNNLSDLLDELQLLSAQRVTAGVKQLYDIIKNRKRTNTQFEEGRDSTTTSSDIGNDDNTPIANQKKRLDDM